MFHICQFGSLFVVLGPYFGCKGSLFSLQTVPWSVIHKTLPEAQRTQGIESITWVNLSTRIVWNWFQWNFLNWLQIWPPDGATCIGCQFCHRMHHLHIDSKFDHQMAPIALVPYLTTRWHHLHWLQTWPPDGTTWISYKFGHQMSPLVLVPNLTTRWLFTNLTTRWHHLHY